MSISESDFVAAIQSLHDKWNEIPDCGGEEWWGVEVVRTGEISAVPYLNLTKLIPYPSSSQSQTHEKDEGEFDPEDILEEPDPESRPHLPLIPSQGRIAITYTIHHSPTYLVPTLYITPPSPSSSSSISLAILSTFLVSAVHALTLHNTALGPLGALTPTTHPETSRTCLWVHPCLTQEGMRGLGLEGKDGVRYLLGWLGIVGAGVGLDVPTDVAREILR